jgi:hypothetical protein
MAMALPWVAEEAWLYSKYDLDFQLAYIASSGIVIAAMSSGSGAVGCCWRVNDRSALFWAAIPSFVCIGSVKNVLNHSIMGKPHIKKPEGLKGRRIGAARHAIVWWR